MKKFVLILMTVLFIGCSADEINNNENCIVKSDMKSYTEKKISENNYTFTFVFKAYISEIDIQGKYSGNIVLYYTEAGDLKEIRKYVSDVSSFSGKEVEFVFYNVTAEKHIKYVSHKFVCN